MANLNTFIEYHNNGFFVERVLPVFNNIRNFLRVVKNKGKQAELSLENIPDYEFWDDPTLFDFLEENGFINDVSPRDITYFDDEVHNIFFLWCLEKKPQETLEFICKKILRDVEFKDGGFYLYLHNRNELSQFFGDNERDRSLARDLLDNDLWDVFSDTIWDNLYSQVIEVLNGRNKEILERYIVKEIGNVVLSTRDYEADFFHNLSQAQGRANEFEITNENVSDLINDEEAILELLNKGLTELKSSLYSLHHGAYNEAWINEAEQLMWDSLERYFDTESWIYDKRTTHSGKEVDYEYIKISDFRLDIFNFLKENKMPEWNDSNLVYYDSYVSFISQQMRDGNLAWLNMGVSEWPDSDEVNQILNDRFTEYIYV